MKWERNDRRPPGRSLAPAVLAVVVVVLLGTGAAGAISLAASKKAEPARLRTAADGAATLATAPAPAPAPNEAAPTAAAPHSVMEPPPRMPAPPTTTARERAGETPGTIGVEVIPAHPVTGQRVRFVVTATQPANCCYLLVDPGDGAPIGPATALCTAKAAGTQRVEFAHVYNKPGEWKVTATADAGLICDRTDALNAVFPNGRHNGQMPIEPSTAALPQLQMKIAVVVAPGTTSSQGQSPPQLELVLSTVDAPEGEVALSGAAIDLDGWVRSVSVDWGDGSPAAAASPAAPCQSGENGWPVYGTTLMTTLPPGARIGGTVAPPTHRYAAPGTYTVTVTAVSTGCDGADEQRVSRSLTWTVV